MPLALDAVEQQTHSQGYQYIPGFVRNTVSYSDNSELLVIPDSESVESAAAHTLGGLTAHHWQHVTGRNILQESILARATYSVVPFMPS